MGRRRMIQKRKGRRERKNQANSKEEKEKQELFEYSTPHFVQYSLMSFINKAGKLVEWSLLSIEELFPI